MQKGMNFISYVGDFKDVRTYLNSDPNRYLNSVSTEAEIEREGDIYLFIKSSALPNTSGDLDLDLSGRHIFYNEFYRIQQFCKVYKNAHSSW